MTDQQALPCGCTEPHDPGHRFPRCAVVTPETEADVRCHDGCISREKAHQEANPGLFLDLADSAMTTCIRCAFPVCLVCQTAPVARDLDMCGLCE